MCWRDEIQKYDRDIEVRMAIIQRHEVTGVDFNSIRWAFKALGFVQHGVFPGWRDHTKEWRNRNRDRVNELGRVQQRNWRLKNLEKARARDKKYYDKKKSLTNFLRVVK
jgi:hypothetical protein